MRQAACCVSLLFQSLSIMGGRWCGDPKLCRLPQCSACCNAKGSPQPCGVRVQNPTWPKRMRVLKEVFETAKPYERPALAQRMEQLVAEPCADGQPGSLLKDLPLQQLHPASWYV